MSAELEESFDDVNITLVADGKGIFDVALDGQLIYSKYETDRFPDAGEVSGIISKQ